MKVEFDLQPRTLKLLKALKELNGYNGAQVSQLVSLILDRGLRLQIIEELELDEHAQRADHDNPEPEEIMSEYLGDVDNSVEEDASMQDLSWDPPVQPRNSRTRRPGITDDILDRDMKVEDPQKEAKAEASSSDDYLFSQLGEDPRAQRRRKPPVKTRAKVTEYNGNDSENPLY